MPEPATRLILAIDAGFAALGAVVVDVTRPDLPRVHWAGVCRTERAARKRGVRVADDDAERCQQLARFLLDAIRAWQPAGAVVELPTGGAQGARASHAMGMAAGVVAAVLEAAGLAVEWVTPDAAKRAAAGRRDASKEAVQAAVEERLSWPDWYADLPRRDWEHIADAAGALLAARHGTLVRALAAVEKDHAR